MNNFSFHPISACVPFMKCPAKAHLNEHGVPELGFNVFDHTYIVGMVANELIRIFPKQFSDQFFPKGTDLVVACHDIGKVSPTFYLKLCTLISTDPQHYHPDLYQNFKGLVDQENKQWGGHSTVSAITLKDAVNDKFIYRIAGSHHGSLHKNTKRSDATDECFGDEEWNNERLALIEALKQRLGSDFPTIENDTQARIMSGLTTVADWIGSGGIFSKPYGNWERHLSDYLHRSVTEAGFHPLNIKKGLSFEQLFGDGFIPNELQVKVYSQGVLQGLNFVEAPMGMGKTETGLFLAYKALEEGMATGIYFALPTQLTSNKIYERFNDFLSRILVDPTQRAQLLHSNAWLMNTHIGEEGEVGRSWFDQSKRKILAPFGVGTIDQTLMSVINVKHNFVRSFGLMGKVVILDEVHSYDVYTGLLMDELIKHLLEMKCTVIVLSATLTQERKKEIMGKEFDVNSAYPLITTYNPNNDDVQQLPVAHNRVNEKSVKVVLSSTPNSFKEAVVRASQGQYVLWIENTIDEAVAVYNKFYTQFHDSEVECGLLHSRFTFTDRQAIEEKWVNLFGKNNPDRIDRKGKILIGTQILEQSLDIDADFLVSRIAPIDLLLQRSGRLWRHSRDNRHPLAQCEMHVLTPTFELAVANEAKDFGASAYVYYPYVLFKTLWTIQNHLSQSSTIEIPFEMTALIEAVYTDADQDTEQALFSYKNTMLYGNSRELGLNKLKQLARANLAKLGTPLKDDGLATTRHIEKEDVQLLLVQHIQRKPTGAIQSMILMDGSTIVMDEHFEKNKKQYALELTQNLVKMSEQKLHKDFQYPPLDSNITALLSFAEKMVVCLVDQGFIKEIHGTQLNNKYAFRYSSQLGLTFKASSS